MAEMKETKKRGAKKIQYQVVARYMDGNEVTGYHLQSINSDKSKRYTKEQTLLIAAKGQITNAVAIITNTGATLSGKNGIKIANLPVVQEQDGKAVLTNSDSLGKVNRNLSIEEAINMFKLTYVIKDGKKKVGYTIQNSGGAEKDITRAETIELAKQNKLGNAFINMCKGVALLRGKGGFKLDDLPVKDISESTLAGATKPEQKTESNVDRKQCRKERIINIAQVQYLGQEIFIAKYVDFGISINGLTKFESKEKLIKFMSEVKKETEHRFIEGSDSEAIYEIDGLKYHIMSEDAKYDKLETYAKLAEKLNADFSVYNKAEIYDKDYYPFNDEEEAIIREKLRLLVEKIRKSTEKSIDNNTIDRNELNKKLETYLNSELTTNTDLLSTFIKSLDSVFEQRFSFNKSTNYKEHSDLDIYNCEINSYKNDNYNAKIGVTVNSNSKIQFYFQVIYNGKMLIDLVTVIKNNTNFKDFREYLLDKMYTVHCDMMHIQSLNK